MKLNELVYTKAESERPERQLLSVKSESIYQDATNDVIESATVPGNYGKDDGTLSQSLVFVLSGGSETERSFFKELILNRSISAVKVLFLSKRNQGLQPYQMEKIWRDSVNDNRIEIDNTKYTLASIDKTFLITDVDEFEEQLERILSEKDPEDQGQWIISNPCFEIWLYHCYGDNVDADLGSLADIDIVHRSQALSALCHQVLPGGMNPVKAFEHLYEGISRSKASYRVKDNGIPELFSTQMHLVAEYILEEMQWRDCEFTRFLEDKRNHIVMYKQSFIDNTLLKVGGHNR